MRKNRTLQIVTVLFSLFFIAVLAWLTMEPTTDPCTESRADIGAAVLADEPGDQEALVNRAIVVKGNCEDRDQ